MRAQFIYETFKEDSDPIHDMGIGMARHLQNIQKALKKMKQPHWDEEEYIEDEFVIKLDSSPDYVAPQDFSNFGKFSVSWEDIGVFDPFEIVYYFDVNLEENRASRGVRITNTNLEGWDWFDQKLISDDVLNLTPEELVALIEKDWFQYSTKEAAIEAHEYAEIDYERTQKRISTY
jgi:hypothetical protein